MTFTDDHLWRRESMATGILRSMDEASEEQIVRYGRVLTLLAAEHGLSNLRRAGDGHIVADIEKGRTYFDVARFEIEAESLLGASVDVLFSATPLGREADRGPLTTSQAA